MTTALTLALAMMLDAVAGEPKWLWSRLPHPAVLMGRAVGALDTRLNTEPGARTKGLAAIVLLVIGAGMIGLALAQLGWVIEVIIAAILLAHRSLIDHVAAVAQGLRQSTGEGRRAVAMIVGRDVSTATPDQVARAGIESLSENFSDGVIAPAFWFLIGGLPGILIYKVVNTADSMIGYLTPRHAEFGWAAARLDDLLNWVPARLTGGLIALAGGVTAQWPAIRTDAALHRSPNAGWPEAAMARAMHIALAGPRSYHGQMEELAWVNPDGRQVIGPADIDAAVRIVWKSWGLALTAILFVGVLIWIF
ncbi:adenosylcobinamide-phosphate synthase CbiB [Tateyamaria sp. ANG-S1]|uniref:adenosylcobinamide-phosphate synthase CbiB n=1 Tax=Tateyamaria sp. ANG-S1 TaxID=1577905 RepID=UPI00057C5F7D|nr:adenosylcobinamide-phosphate synthase CbiB [Tateyamaria sp. ANG-S1]KIC51968.1 cobalamin biosynthesis protein CobD [Tateyamaria sp. ANG-S1]